MEFAQSVRYRSILSDDWDGSESISKGGAVERKRESFRGPGSVKRFIF